MPTALDDIDLSVNPFADLIPASNRENPFADLIPASDESYEGQLRNLGITPEQERQAKGNALRAELAFEQGDQLEKEARRQAVADYNRRQDNAISRTEAVRGVTRSTLQMGEGFSGAAETAAKLFGGPDAGETPKAFGDYFAARAKAIPAAVPSLRDVEDVGSFAEYGAKALGELFPQIVTSMIPAAGAAKLGKAVGLGKKGIAALTGAGAAASSIPQEVGGMFREIRDTTGQEAPLTAIGFGIPAGLLDSITPGRLVGKVLGATSKEAKKLAWREVVRNAVKEIPKSAATEGLTEPTQESLALAANKTADSSYDAVNEENFWRLLDAAAMGAIGGGVFGGGTTVGATALNKVSRNQEAIRLKNLRRGRDDARSRLVVEPTPEVPLTQEFIALQQDIDEQQRERERGTIVGRVVYQGLTYEKAADGQWYSPESSRPLGGRSSASKADIAELEHRLKQRNVQQSPDTQAVQTERTSTLFPSKVTGDDSKPGESEVAATPIALSNGSDKAGRKTSAETKVAQANNSEAIGNEYAARQLLIENAGGLKQWLRAKALEAGQSVEDFYASERELEQESKAVFRSGLTVDDTLIVSGDEILKLPNGQQATVPLVKRFKVIKEDGRLIAESEDGKSFGLEADSGQHFFNALKAPTMGGKILGRKLSVIRKGESYEQLPKTEEAGAATATVPGPVVSEGTRSEDSGARIAIGGPQWELHARYRWVPKDSETARIWPEIEGYLYNDPSRGPSSGKRGVLGLISDDGNVHNVWVDDGTVTKLGRASESGKKANAEAVAFGWQAIARGPSEYMSGRRSIREDFKEFRKTWKWVGDDPGKTYEDYKRSGRTSQSSDVAVRGAIAEARINGPSPEFRALFGGIDPELAGTTPDKVSAFAATLGMKWYPVTKPISEDIGSEGTTKGGEETRQETKEVIPKQTTPVVQLPTGVVEITSADVEARITTNGRLPEWYRNGIGNLSAEYLVGETYESAFRRELGDAGFYKEQIDGYINDQKASEADRAKSASKKAADPIEVLANLAIGSKQEFSTLTSDQQATIRRLIEAGIVGYEPIGDTRVRYRRFGDVRGWLDKNIQPAAGVVTQKIERPLATFQTKDGFDIHLGDELFYVTQQGVEKGTVVGFESHVIAPSSASRTSVLVPKLKLKSGEEVVATSPEYLRKNKPETPASASVTPVSAVFAQTATTERLRIPAINKGTRETTDLSAFRIQLPTDVLLIDAQGNSPSQDQVRLTYRTSGKNPGLRLYVDNRPAYEITLPAGAVTKDATGIFVDPVALIDTGNWKRVGKTPERSPFTLERDTKKKPVAQQRAAEEATDKKGDLLPLALVPGSPVVQNYEYDEAKVADTHTAQEGPKAVIDLLEQDPALVASVNSNDPTAAQAAARELFKANALKVGQILDDFLAQEYAEQAIKEIQENKDMLSVMPGARLVSTRIIASGKGAAEITALLTNPAIDPAVVANGRKLLAALPSQYTDGLTLNIVERQEQDGQGITLSGSFSAATGIATILQSTENPDTALHEASHWLSTFLNPVERARNNQLWRQELDRELAIATGDRLAILQAIKDANGLTSQEYLAQSQTDTSVYHLTNPDEFFAYRFTNQARGELKRDNAIDYVRNLLKRILEAVKRLVGREDFYDAVWRKFMAGEFSVDALSGPLFERNKYGVAASLEPIASREAYKAFMRGSQTATPEINQFKQTVSWFHNESVVGRITNSFTALPRGVKSELDFLRGRLAAMADALADLGTAPNVTGNVVARAQALSPDPIEQNQLIFSVVNGTMEVEHAGRALDQRVAELDKELRSVQTKDTKDSAFADLANDILSKAPPAQRTLLRQSNMTVFLEGGTIGAAETVQAIAATSSYANLAAKVADANNGISRKQRILEYQLNNATQARQFVSSQVLSDPRTQQDYREAIAARGVRAVVLNEAGGTITYQDPLAPTDRSKDVTVSFSLDAADILVNQQKLLDLSAKMEQYLQTGTDELRKAAYVDELDRIWNYHLSTRNFPATGKLLFGKGDVFRWLTFGGRVAIPDYITKFIGGEPARKLSIALKNYSEARQQAMNHQDRLRQNIYTAIYRAAKAHKMTRAEWMRKVGKPILDSHAAFGAVRPLKTGMKLAGNIVVLRSDMEAIEAQATFFRIVAGSVAEMSAKLSAAQPSPVLIYEQATAKRPAYERKPLQASRFMLPRMIGRVWRNLAPKWLVAQKAGNVAALVEMVNDPAHWQGFLSHLRAYEDPSYVIKSDFVQAYRMVQEDIYNGNVPADFDSLVTMVDLELGGTVPRADIEEKMLGEFTEVMRLLNNPVTPSEVDISIISAENFMNNPRGQSIAPPGMYEIGLDTEGSQFSLISQVAEVYGQRYLNALQGVKEALEKKAVEYKGREKSGVTRKQVEKESREAQIAGDTFVNYQELLTLQKQVFHQLQQFKELAQSKQGFDVEMSRGLRLLGNITGALLQTPGVLFRNSLGGPIRAVGIDAAIGYSTSIFGVRLPIISTALNTSKNALLFARGARQLAMGMISNRMARTAAGRAALRTLQRNPTFWNSTAQWLASVMNKNAQAYQTADDLGLLKEAPIKEQIGNYFRLFSEGGRIVGDDPKAMAKFIRSFESVVGILFEIGIPIPILFSRKVLPATVDDALNQSSDFFTKHITEYVSKNALKSLAARASLNARTDELTPQEVLGRSSATAKQLEWLRLLFDQNNISLDRALIEYYQNVEAAKVAGQDPNAVQFLTPQQYDSLRLTFANELNRAGFMNRPALFAKSPLARAFGTFFGYPAQTNTQFSVFMSKHSRDTRTLAGREGFLLAMQMMLMIIIFGTLIAAPGADLLHRLFYNRERQVPQLSSAKDGWDFARIAFMQSGALMPTVGGVFNYMIEQTKPGMGMGGSGVSLLPLSLFNGTMEALRAAYQTGDVIRPAISFVRRWIPNTQIVLNRTPFMEGSIEGGNVRAILDRNAPTSIERRGFGFGGNIKRSATSDDIDGIVNAIYRGETATAKRLTDKAVEERRAAGIAKPENSVYSSVLSRNPYNSLFGKTLTEGERELVFSRLKPQDRARVTRAEDAFQSYAQSSGRNEPTFVSSRGTTPRRSRSRTRSYRSRSRRFSIRSRNRFRIRGLGRRRNRRLLRV